MVGSWAASAITVARRSAGRTSTRRRPSRSARASPTCCGWYARRGFKRQDELDVSPRFLEITKTGPAAEEGIAPYLSAMVDEYYNLHGWNVDTGTPTTDTLTRLGMEEFAAAAA